MEILEVAPLAVCLMLHLGGFTAALLNRVAVGYWATCVLRITLLAFLVAICGLALQARADAFHQWTLSAITLGAIVVVLVYHGESDSQDPVLARLLASGE